MNRSGVTSVTIAVDDAHSVRGLLLAPPSPRACYVLAHGAGAECHQEFEVLRGHCFVTGASANLPQAVIKLASHPFDL
jgi:hypothetical protein